MRQTELIMGMPVTVEVVGAETSPELLAETFVYFRAVDEQFSTYKPTSEISRINRGELRPEEASAEMQLIFRLAEETRGLSDGYFDIGQVPSCDPSGIVKGWAIDQAARRLLAKGVENFYVEAGGDIAVHGLTEHGRPWRIGIRHPFRRRGIVRVLQVKEGGVATSGTYERGEHIYNPYNGRRVTEVVSLTVIGPDIYEADRFATAAFAMGRRGIEFIEKFLGLEGYQIDATGTATMTSGFLKHVVTA